jgi:hypothetical protein
MRSTMTAEQALRQAEDYVHAALSVLPPEARLEVLTTPGSHACDDPTDNGPRGRVFASNSYWIQGLDPSRVREYLDALVRWWAEHDFVGPVESWDKAQFVSMENKNDGFRMLLQDGGNGKPSIGASSPCVWPRGMPEPSS